MTSITEWSNYIKENIDLYLSADEKTDLLKQQLKVVDNEKMNNLTLNMTIGLVALEIVFILRKIIQNQEFAEGNPYNPLEEPYGFLFHQYCVERFGMNNDYMTTNYCMN